MVDMTLNSANKIKDIPDLETGDRAEVVIDRYSSSSGHFITYPSNSNYDSSKDGIHVELPDTETTEIKSLLDQNRVVIKAKVEITDTEGYISARLGGKLIVGFDSSEDELGEVQDIFQDLIDSEKITVDASNIQIRIDITTNKDRSSSTEKKADNVSTARSKNVRGSKGRKTRTLREVELDKPEPSNADINGILLYYVNSGTADCYHTREECEGLRQKEGDIMQVVQQGDELPDEISDRRGCHRCT
jgi:hypothetical protein